MLKPHRFFYFYLLIISLKCCIIIQYDCEVCVLAQKKGKNKFGITPSMIFLNLLLVLIICTVCFFTYNIINSEDNTSSEPPFTAVTSAPKLPLPLLPQAVRKSPTATHPLPHRIMSRHLTLIRTISPHRCS